MGQAFPILVRGIDLSIGAIVGVVGMVVFDLTLIFHLPGYAILPLALVVGALAGALDGDTTSFSCNSSPSSRHSPHSRPIVD